MSRAASKNQLVAEAVARRNPFPPAAPAGASAPKSALPTERSMTPTKAAAASGEGGEGLGTKVGAEDEEGTERKEGGQGIVEFALYEELLFEEGQEGRIEEKYRYYAQNYDTCYPAEGILQEAVQACIFLGRKEHRKDARREGRTRSFPTGMTQARKK